MSWLILFKQSFKQYYEFDEKKHDFMYLETSRIRKRLVHFSVKHHHFLDGKLTSLMGSSR